MTGWALIACSALPGRAWAEDGTTGCVPAPAAGQLSAASARRDALLGGATSRLQQISAQQAGVGPIAPPSPDCFRALTVSPAAITPGMLDAEAPRAGLPDVFGSVAMAVSRTPFDANWGKVRAASPGAGSWSPMLSMARTQPRAAQLAMVNGWVNAHVAFVDDIRREGVADRWALPGETLKSGRGDCEDYAIAKLGLLRELGIPADEMFLVIARDLVRRADHAVLAVRVDGRLFVLDNQTDRILDAAEVQDYRPVMSYAGNRAWTHGYRADPVTAPLRTASAAMTGGR